MKTAILLSGSGVYDGSEISESIFTALALNESSIAFHFFAPNRNQHHVINHITGEEMNETRNILTESARIARGDIFDLNKLEYKDYHSLIMIGGFGAAKNHSNWAFNRGCKCILKFLTLQHP